MSKLLRSEQMSLVQIFFSQEASYNCVRELGELVSIIVLGWETIGYWCLRAIVGITVCFCKHDNQLVVDYGWIFNKKLIVLVL